MDSSRRAPESSSINTTLDTLPLENFLAIIGQRIRQRRNACSLSRKRLAEISGVSERYLAQLEAGQGNISIVLLRKVTSSLEYPLQELMSGELPRGWHTS
ncbi:MAG: hypothetical protein CSB44_12415 [Gammaproteobacteria bacterium]|nr:MAG: hypothetical protein CSB44_12415 [Gammaproteobacteria bacterium]